MSRSSLGFVVLMLSFVAIGAGGCGSDSCESERPELCGGGGSGGTGGIWPGSGSILGTSPASYSEADETNNGTGTPEDTDYVLEDDNGLAIEGMFESGTPTRDVYLFNSGAFGGASEPDFPGADIRVFVDGDEIEGSGAGISLGLDTVQDTGYSSLSGSYFINAALFSGRDYLLNITPGASVAGKPYVIEIRGHIEDDEPR